MCSAGLMPIRRNRGSWFAENEAETEGETEAETARPHEATGFPNGWTIALKAQCELNGGVERNLCLQRPVHWSIRRA